MGKDKMGIGFIGLGIMGGPMAMNILKAGFKLQVYDCVAEKMNRLRQAGAAVSKSAAAVAADSDIVITCLPDTPDVLAVMLNDKNGVVAGVKKGALVIDCSTVDPEVAAQCSQALGAKGCSFLDAPVSGGDIGAKAGALSIMVGGEKADFDIALPVLEAMGKTITHCGANGAGYTVKLCNQILCGLHMLAAAEALSLAVAADVDPQAMLKAVSSGAAGSWMLSNMASKMVAGDFAPGFRIDYHLKDLRITHDAAHKLNVPLPATAIAETMMRIGSAMGLGDQGTQALYQVVRTLQGAASAGCGTDIGL